MPVMPFNKGDEVETSVGGAGLISTDPGTKRISRVSEKSVWLDNGPGNDESGPFDRLSGQYKGPQVPGFRMWITRVRR